MLRSVTSKRTQQQFLAAPLSKITIPERLLFLGSGASANHSPHLIG